MKTTWFKSILCAFSAAFLVVLHSCNTRTTIYKGQYNGQTIEVKNIEKKDPFSLKLSQTIQLGNLKPLEISEFTTNGGMPFSDDLYGNTIHQFMDTTHSDEIANNPALKVMLYVSPEKYSVDEFNQYAAFMRSEWTKIKDKIELNQGYRKINIGGMLYGKDEDFEQIFTTQNGYAVTIKTNGDIFYGRKGVESTNLSHKVGMPGKVIMLLKQGGDLNMMKLKDFKDKNGKTLFDYFNIKQE